MLQDNLDSWDHFMSNENAQLDLNSPVALLYKMSAQLDYLEKSISEVKSAHNAAIVELKEAISELEIRTRAIENHKSYMLGLAAAISFVISLLGLALSLKYGR